MLFGRGFPQQFLAKLQKTEGNSEEFSKLLWRRETPLFITGQLLHNLKYDMERAKVRIELKVAKCKSVLYKMKKITNQKTCVYVNLNGIEEYDRVYMCNKVVCIE